MCKLTKYPSQYKTAEDTETNLYWKVIAQDAPSKDDAKHLLIQCEEGDPAIWWPIEDGLRPCL